MPLISLFMGKGPSGFGHGSTAEDATEGLDLHGRNILVTGCNSGIGLETVRVLALRGARVLATARTVEKATAACATMSGKTTPFACELSEPASVRACVEAVEKDGSKLDAIVCNAGIMAPPALQKVHGCEIQFFTNHVGHFMLVTGLLGALADDGRVVMVSSEAHKGAPEDGIEFDNLSGDRGYARWKAYGQAKLANILFAKELARRFAGTQKTANALHPGVIKTNLVREFSAVVRGGMALLSPLVFKSVPQGAATQCYVATAAKAAAVSGEYFSDCNVARSSALSRDAALATRLWARTEEIVASLA